MSLQKRSKSFWQTFIGLPASPSCAMDGPELNAIAATVTAGKRNGNFLIINSPPIKFNRIVHFTQDLSNLLRTAHRGPNNPHPSPLPQAGEGERWPNSGGETLRNCYNWLMPVST